MARPAQAGRLAAMTGRPPGPSRKPCELPVRDHRQLSFPPVLARTWHAGFIRRSPRNVLTHFRNHLAGIYHARNYASIYIYPRESQIRRANAVCRYAAGAPRVTARQAYGSGDGRSLAPLAAQIMTYGRDGPHQIGYTRGGHRQASSSKAGQLRAQVPVRAQAPGMSCRASGMRFR